MGILTFDHFIISCEVLHPLSFLGKLFGKVKAPRRVFIFVWTITYNRILTGDNLRLTGFDFVDWCIMHRCCGETIDHLLLHCEMARQLWNFVFKSFGI